MTEAWPAAAVPGFADVPEAADVAGFADAACVKEAVAARVEPGWISFTLEPRTPAPKLSHSTQNCCQTELDAAGLTNRQTFKLKILAPVVERHEIPTGSCMHILG